VFVLAVKGLYVTSEDKVNSLFFLKKERKNEKRNKLKRRKNKKYP
jgi:hypothetical protein